VNTPLASCCLFATASVCLQAAVLTDPKKTKKEEEQAVLNALFKPVEQKVSKGMSWMWQHLFAMR